MRLDKTKVSAEHLKYRRNLKDAKIIIHVLQVAILVGFLDCGAGRKAELDRPFLFLLPAVL